MYHFRIKSDKKPNGTKISAVQHVEYINREGKFSTPEQWQQKNKFGGDFISTEKFPNAFDGQNILLYKTDDFGSIKNSQRGIEVTKNASEETIATALVLAYETMNHQPLVINGSEEFKKAVLKTAVLQDLPISFDDLIMQNDFLRYKEVDYPDRKKYALDTAQKILQHMEKTNAQSHLEYINRERKKTAQNHPLKKNGGEEHRKPVNGAIINMLPSFALTLLKFKMLYWSRMASQFE